MRPRRAVAIACLVLVSTVSACSSGSTGRHDAFRGAVIDPPRSVLGTAIPDAANGDRPFSFRAAPGHLLLVYFGYTNCPDICPTTLSDIRRSLTLPELASHRSDVDLAMVTVDPERDTGPLLTRYLESFHRGAHALRTENPDVLATIAKTFGATYSVVDPGHNLPREVGHSALTYGVDDRGKLVAQWAFGTPSADFAHDFAMILEGRPLLQRRTTR